MLNISPSLKKDLRSVRENGEPEIHERVDLRAWTSLGIGGLADLLVRCRSADGLQRALDVLATHGYRWLVLGAGSRLVPPDRGLRIPVVNLSGGLGLWELDLDGVVAGGGANLAQLSRAAARTGLSGAEGLIATASSLGGAVHAACHGHLELAAILDWLEIAAPGRSIERIRLPERRGQRRPIYLELERRVVVRARLQLVGESSRPVAPSGTLRHRHRVQRPPRSAEPLFADPLGGKAEALLADADCADMKVGGARISTRHPNRVRTSKTASADDVLELTRMVRDRVATRHDIDLEPAICFVDEDGGTIEL